ncbi:MAG: hypothetical protein J0H99_15640, partial [Rhodospirillales bacterium]|nr:hypothetical protein [Rhodospirillales bacterium]
PHPESPHGFVTVSLGVATAWPQATSQPGDEMILTAAADNALYEAKGAGRNGVRGTELDFLALSGRQARA